MIVAAVIAANPLAAHFAASTASAVLKLASARSWTS